MTDESGAVISGAKVSVIDLSTRFERGATTNDDGYFVVPALPPGTYKVRVERDSFAPADINNVVLNANDRRSLQVSLKVGRVGEAVEIKADEGQLQLKSESGERSDVITNRQIVNLAMNGRNVFALMNTIPGAINNLNTEISKVDTQNQFNINGNRQNSNEITLDGASILVQGNNTMVFTTINPDAVAEVKVVTSNYQAEFGKMSGASIQFVTKSGTRDFHGTGRYFRRHDSLNANNYFNNARRVPRNLYRYDYGGFDIGGPVYLPKPVFGPLGGWNQGKDKLFFFFSQEFYEQLIPEAARNIRVPTLAERSGDFSATTDGPGNRIFLRDPLMTGTCNATNTPQNPGACFVYQGRLNVIDPARFYRLGQNILKLYPEPNVPGDARRIRRQLQPRDRQRDLGRDLESSGRPRAAIALRAAG